MELGFFFLSCYMHIIIPHLNVSECGPARPSGALGSIISWLWATKMVRDGFQYCRSWKWVSIILTWVPLSPQALLLFVRLNCSGLVAKSTSLGTFTRPPALDAVGRGGELSFVVSHIPVSFSRSYVCSFGCSGGSGMLVTGYILAILITFFSQHYDRHCHMTL